MDVQYQNGKSILQYPLPIWGMDPAAAVWYWIFVRSTADLENTEDIAPADIFTLLVFFLFVFFSEHFGCFAFCTFYQMHQHNNSLMLYISQLK